MGKRAEQKKETLERLRNIIDELVAQKGFESVTIREICEKAGVSTGVFYYYFDSKADILYDRFQRANNAWYTFEKELLTLSPRESLHKTIQHMISYMLTRVPSVSLPYHKAILSDYQHWTEQEPDHQRQLLHSLFLRAAQENTLRPSPFTPDQLADMLWSMTFGIRMCMHMDGYPEFYEKTAAGDQLHAWLDAQFID